MRKKIITAVAMVFALAGLAYAGGDGTQTTGTAISVAGSDISGRTAASGNHQTATTGSWVTESADAGFDKNGGTYADTSGAGGSKTVTNGSNAKAGSTYNGTGYGAATSHIGYHR